LVKKELAQPGGLTLPGSKGKTMKKRLFALILCISLVSCKAPPPLVDTLLEGKCKKVWESPTGPGVSGFLFETYNGKGCKLSKYSPNGEYLAYVTLSSTAPQSPYVDTVKIIKTDTGTDKPIYISSEMDFIGGLEWTPTDKLLIRENIWEGPWVIFLYDPDMDSIAYAFRLDQNGKLEWNPQGTILYASHSGEYGHGSCVTELGGYDFQFNNAFPDFYEIYGMEKSDDWFGIPYGEKDNLSIEPFAWSKDGQNLFIVITPLTLLESGIYYRQEPKQAGVIDFSEQRASFTILGADSNLNYFFMDKENPTLVSEPYSPKDCPTIE
jgi:hypothetical protein